MLYVYTLYVFVTLYVCRISPKFDIFRFSTSSGILYISSGMYILYTLLYQLDVYKRQVLGRATASFWIRIN